MVWLSQVRHNWIFIHRYKVNRKGTYAKEIVLFDVTHWLRKKGRDVKGDLCKTYIVDAKIY